MKRNEFDPQYAELITRMGNKSYSREQKYLLSFAEDFKECLEQGEWWKNNLETAREKSKTYWDFICLFDSLKEKMNEFHWTCEFMKANGIDFKSLRKLYFAVA